MRMGMLFKQVFEVKITLQASSNNNNNNNNNNKFY